MSFFIKNFFLIALLLLSNTVTAGNRLAIIIDEDQDEIAKKSNLGALTFTLDKLLHEQCCIVLVSGNILRIFIDAHTSEKKHPLLTKLSKNIADWDIFKIYGLDFFIIIPRHYLNKKGIYSSPIEYRKNYSLGLVFKNLVLLDKNMHTAAELKKKLKNSHSPKLKFLDFENILLKNKRTQQRLSDSWNVYIVGHGGRRSFIAGAAPENIRKLLDFFDKSLNTKTVYIDSCYAGGKNKFSLMRDSSEPTYSFDLIIGCTTDAPSISEFAFMSFTNFFVSLEQPLRNYSSSSENSNMFHQHRLAAHYLGPSISSKDDFGIRHGLTCMPQILAAHKRCFSIPNKNDEFLYLDEYAAEVTTTLPTTKAIIFGTQYFPIVLNVSPSKSTRFLKTGNDPFTTEFYLTEKMFRLNNRSKTIFDDFEPFIDVADFIRKNKISPKERMLSTLKRFVPENTLFPRFISATHPHPDTVRKNKLTSAYHRIGHINIDNQLSDNLASPFFGILRFFYDAFFDIGDRISANTFLIDSLEGPNDLSIFFELSALFQKTFNRERTDFLGTIENPRLDLSYIIVTTQGGLTYAKSEPFLIKIQFLIGDTCWSYDFQGTLQEFQTSIPWNFKKRSALEHLRLYRQLLSNIPETENQN